MPCDVSSDDDNQQSPGDSQGEEYGEYDDEDMMDLMGEEGEMESEEGEFEQNIMGEEEGTLISSQASDEVIK